MLRILLMSAHVPRPNIIAGRLVWSRVRLDSQPMSRPRRLPICFARSTMTNGSYLRSPDSGPRLFFGPGTLVENEVPAAVLMSFAFLIGKQLYQKWTANSWTSFLASRDGTPIPPLPPGSTGGPAGWARESCTLGCSRASDPRRHRACTDGPHSRRPDSRPSGCGAL